MDTTLTLSYLSLLTQAKNAFEEKAAKKQQEITVAEEAASSPNDDEGIKRDAMETLVHEAQEQAVLKRNLEGDLKMVLLPQKTLERQLHNLKRQQTTAEQELRQAKQRLQEVRDQILGLSGSAESDEARRAAALRKTEEELAAAREKVNGMKQAVSNALREYEEKEPHVQDAKSKVEQITRQFHGANNTIKELESSSDDSLAVFGYRVSKVHQIVSHLRGFVVSGCFLSVAIRD
jgi:chromosome segregation ATPase